VQVSTTSIGRFQILSTQGTSELCPGLIIFLYLDRPSLPLWYQAAAPDPSSIQAKIRRSDRPHHKYHLLPEGHNKIIGTSLF
jgi:hypothetical protein